MLGSLLFCGLFSLGVGASEIEAFLGVPYARRLEQRFQPSQLIGEFDETADYSKKWPNRCPIEGVEEGIGEDCLYLNIFKLKGVQEKVPCLLYITNEELSRVKLERLISKDLTLVVAHARQGPYASFDGHLYGTKDVENIFTFLENEKHRFHIGEITVLAEEHLAEIVSLSLEKIGAKRAILFGGNALSRSIGREKFPQKTASRLLKASQCDLPSENQALDCLRALSFEDFSRNARIVKESFYPFGDPFRVPVNRRVANRQIPTIYGLWKKEPTERYAYPVTANFTADYLYGDFKRFLAGLLPDSAYKNGPLLRRLALHHYIHTKGNKKDTYFLFEKMRSMLYERDFAVPTERLVMHLAKSKKNSIYLFEYAIDNPPKNCLQDGGWDDIEPFCTRLLGYYTRFASKGAPTEEGCNPDNPSFPALRSTKRDYYVKIHADGKTEWDFDFYREAVAFWSDLIPSMDSLELAGRRDAIFPEEQESDPLDVEDDTQTWHKAQAAEGREFDQKQARNEL